MTDDVSKLPEVGTLISVFLSDKIPLTGVIVSYEFISFFFVNSPFWIVNILLGNGEILRLKTNSWIWTKQISVLSDRGDNGL